MYGSRKVHWMSACRIEVAVGLAFLAFLLGLVAAAPTAIQPGQTLYKDAQVPSAARQRKFSASTLPTATSHSSLRLLKGSDAVSGINASISVSINASGLNTLAPADSSESSSSSGNLSNSTDVSKDAAATAAAALLPLSASDLGHAVESPLIPPVEYYYKTVNGSEAMPLGLPLHYTPGLDLTRWVLSAWSISRQSALRAPAGLVDSTMQRVEQLINNFTRMSPGQVQLTATANVTVPYVFRGVGQWTGDATEAMRKCASAAAGGYDPAYINVLLDPPDFGVKTLAFGNSNAAPIASVYRQKKVVYYPTDSGSRQRYSRKLLQFRSLSAESSSSSAVPWVSDSPVKKGKTSNNSQWTHVWVSYHRLDPLNVTILLQSLSEACGAVDLVQAADLTATRCGQYTQQWLQQAGMQIDSSSYVEYLKNKPMVSVSVRLAVGVTQQQAESNTDTAIALWLAQPRNIAGAINASGLPDPIGPDSLIKWIVTPEIWGAQKPPGSARPPGNPAGLPPGTIAGISIACAAFAALASGLIMYFIDRRNKRLRLEDKTDTESSASSRHRRRRRHTKPRYLLPDPLPPPAEATTSSSTADGAQAVQPGQPEDSDDLSPDQIRPAMKELGDSVTSAARFELEEPDEDNTGEQGGTNPQGDRVEPGPIQGGGNRVLAARRALVLERQATGPSGTNDIADGTVSVGDLSNRRGGWLPPGDEVETTTHHHTDVGAASLWSPFANIVNQGLTSSSIVPVDAIHTHYVDQQSKQCLSSVVKPNVVSIAQQQEPGTPPRPVAMVLPSRSLQPSPELESTCTMSSITSPTALEVVEAFGSKPLSNSMGVSCSKSNKSPFVRSYDLSQLASAVPDLNAGLAVASSGRDLVPRHGPSDSGLHGIDSTIITVLSNGQVSVIDG